MARHYECTKCHWIAHFKMVVLLIVNSIIEQLLMVLIALKTYMFYVMLISL